MSDNVKIDKFRGSILGLAIGDAMGMPFEGLTSDMIKGAWQNKDFISGSYQGLRAGQYTDDTLMMICHLENLIERRKVDPEHLSSKFIEWFDSRDLRGIGRTTLYAITRLKQGYPWDKSGSEDYYAAGNGGAMRIAPVGLFYHRDLEGLREAVQIGVMITHNNSEAISGALAVAYLVARGVREDLNPETAISDTVAYLGDSQVSNKLVLAQELLSDEVTPSEALKTLGVSGYVLETVASAIYCFLYTPRDFEETVVNAVLGGGDTDTIAAVAGAISGAFNGMENIPQRWLEGVEGKERFIEMADELHEIWEGEYNNSR